MPVRALLPVTPTPDIPDCTRQTGEGGARQRARVVPLICRAPCFTRTRREGGGNGGGAVSAPHSLGREGTAGVGGIVSHVAVHPCAFSVTDLQGPLSERTQMEKLRDLKKLAQQYARDRGSCDDTRISYLEMLEDSAGDNLRLAQMTSG
jgi:hypothetical protein